MTVSSFKPPAILSPSQQQALRARSMAVLDLYLHHRPNVQRGLTAGFVLYCIGSTYLSLTGRGAKRETGREAKRRGKKGKPAMISAGVGPDSVE